MTTITRPGLSATAIALNYTQQLGWAVEVCHDHLYLPMGYGMAAVAIHHLPATAVAEHLLRHHSCGPLLRMNAEPCTWIFLADPNGDVFAQSELPAGVAVLSCPERVPLPGTVDSLTRWILQPNPGNRTLPTVTAVLGALASSGYDSPKSLAHAEPT